MQDPFEFNAPKTYQFLAATKPREPTDFALNLTDPNDYWFMVTHVEISPQKEQPNHADADPETNSRGNVVEPIRRSHAGQRIEEPQPKRQAQEKEADNPPKTKPNINRKTEHPKKETKQPHQTEKEQAQERRFSKRVATSKPKLPERFSSKPQQDQSKALLKRNQSMGVLTKTRREQSKDIRPCPFPPRIQREWEKGSKRQWYSLSPESKVEAEKTMQELRQAKQGKANVEKQKSKKEGRFRF